jgi:hypothetical protein
VEAAEKKRQALMVVAGSGEVENFDSARSSSADFPNSAVSAQSKFAPLAEIHVYEAMLAFCQRDLSAELASVGQAIELVLAIFAREGLTGDMATCGERLTEALLGAGQQRRLLRRLCNSLETSVRRKAVDQPASEEQARLLVFFVSWYLRRRSILKYENRGQSPSISPSMRRESSFCGAVFPDCERGGQVGFLVQCSGVLFSASANSNELIWICVTFEVDGVSVKPRRGWESWGGMECIDGAPVKNDGGLTCWLPLSFEEGSCVLDQVEHFVPYEVFGFDSISGNTLDCRIVAQGESDGVVGEWIGTARIPERGTERTLPVPSPYERLVWSVNPVRGESLIIERVSARRIIKSKASFIEAHLEFSLELVERQHEEVFFSIRLYDSNGRLCCDHRSVHLSNGTPLSDERYTISHPVGADYYRLDLLFDDNGSLAERTTIEVVATTRTGRPIVGDTCPMACDEGGEIVVPERVFVPHQFRSGFEVSGVHLSEVYSASGELIPALIARKAEGRVVSSQHLSALLLDENRRIRSSLGTKLHFPMEEESQVCFPLPGMVGQWKWVEPELHSRYVQEGWRTLVLQSFISGASPEDLCLPVMTNTRQPMSVERILQTGRVVNIVGAGLEICRERQQVSLRVYVQVWGGAQAAGNVDVSVLSIMPQLMGSKGLPIGGQGQGVETALWDVPQLNEGNEGMDRRLDYAISVQREFHFSWTLPEGALKKLDVISLQVGTPQGKVVHHAEFPCSQESRPLPKSHFFRRVLRPLFTSRVG